MTQQPFGFLQCAAHAPRTLILVRREKRRCGRKILKYLLRILEGLLFLLKFLEVLDDFLGGAGAVGVVDQFFFCCRPRSIVQAAG